MEIAEKGVTVHMVCPGPVDTPFFKRHFGAVLGEVSSISIYTEWVSFRTVLYSQRPKAAEDPGKKDSTRVTAERCAHLTVVALANCLDEVWISKNPILFFVYLLHYCPNLANWWAHYP